MKNIVTKISAILLAVVILFTGSSVHAQETTKQRTTGTYLPVQAATMKEEKVINVEEKNSVELKDGTVKVDLPEQFYDRNVRVVIRRVSWENNTAVPSLKIEGETFIGNDIYEVTALEEETGKPVFDLDQPITIQFRYFDNDVKDLDESSLKVRYFNRLDQVWEEVDRHLDMDSNTISIETDHFSLFAITGLIKNPEDKTVQTGGISWLLILLIILAVLSILGVGGWLIYNYYVQSKHIYTGDDLILGGGSSRTPTGSAADDTNRKPLNKSQNSINADPPLGTIPDDEEIVVSRQDKQDKKEENDDDDIDAGPSPEEEIWVKF